MTGATASRAPFGGAHNIRLSGPARRRPLSLIVRRLNVGPTGKPETNRYLRLYVRRQGRWQLVAHQATRVARLEVQRL